MQGKVQKNGEQKKPFLLSNFVYEGTQGTTDKGKIKQGTIILFIF